MNDVAMPSVRIERVLAAPIGTIWAMWTDPEHFAQWYGPNGATITVAAMDVRVGGTRRICMEVRTPGGPMKMWFTGHHVLVDEPYRLAYTEAMSDEEGNVLSPSQTGMPASHRAVTEVTVLLTEEPGGTRMLMTHVGIPAGSPGEQGWTMAFDKLDAALAPR